MLNELILPEGYESFITDLKSHIQHSQFRVTLARKPRVNNALLTD
jgi:hypothetical protein